MKKIIALSLSILMGAVFSPIFNSSAFSRSNGGQDNANPTFTAGSGINITRSGNNFTFTNTAPGSGSTFDDSTFSLFNHLDPTKVLHFNLSNLTTGTTRTLEIPDANGFIILDTATQTLTNKSLDGTMNTFTNIPLTTGVTGTLPVSNGGTGTTTTPTNGQVPIGNGTNYVANTLTAGTGITVTNGAGTITIASTGGGGPSALTSNQAAPKWTNTTQLNISNMAIYDSTGSAALVSGSHTVNVTAGVADGIAQSSNLSGTVSNASNTSVVGSGTSFTTDFIVGDTIYIGGADAQAYKITAITDNTHLTISRNGDNNVAGIAYNRGGLATDTAYYLYAISQAAGASPAYMLSTRSISNGDTLVDLPVGYTLFRQIPFVQLTDDAVGAISGTKAGFIKFHVTEFSASASHIIWMTYAIPNVGDTTGITFFNIANSANSTALTGNAAFTPVTTNAPKGVEAIDATMTVQMSSAGQDTITFADSSTGVSSGNGGITVQMLDFGLSNTSPPVSTLLLPLSSTTGQFWYKVSPTSMTGQLSVYGYHLAGIK